MSGVYTVLSTASLWKCRRSKLRLSLLFRNWSSRTQCLCGFTQRKRQPRQLVSLLFTTAYELISPEDKLQCQSFDLPNKLGFILVLLNPHLFKLRTATSPPHTAALLTKVVNNIFVSVTVNIVENITLSLHLRFPLGMGVHAPDLQHFRIKFHTSRRSYYLHWHWRKVRRTAMDTSFASFW